MLKRSKVSNIKTLIIVQLTQYINVTKSLLGTEESNLDLDEPRPVFGRRDTRFTHFKYNVI